MTDEKKNNPRMQSNSRPFPETLQIREQAERKAQSTQQPDFSSMTPEEIEQRFHELQVKQIEAGLQNNQLRGLLEEKDDLASLFSIVTENMLDMVALTDMEGNFLFAGKSHEILGYEPGFLIGKNVMDFVHPEDLPRILEEFGEFVTSGHPRKVEYRNRCEDGAYIWLETLGNFIADENSIPQKIVFSSRDITERKLVEDALRESEARFRLLYEKAPLGYQSLDEKGHFIQVNQAWLDTLGYIREEVIGKSFADFLHPDWRDHFKENFPRFKAIGEILGVEFEMVKKNGAFILVSFNGKISKDKKGNFQQTQCIFYDITERKQAEENLRESEKLLSRAQEIAHIGSWKLDLTANQLTWSDETYRIFGCKPQEFASTYEAFLDFVHPDDRAAVDEAYSRSQQDGSDGYEIEHRIVRRNSGEVRYVHERCVHERDATGTIIQSTGMIQDITERKKAEKEIAEQHSLIKAIYSNAPLIMMVVDANRRLQQVNGFATRFAGRPAEEMLGLRGGEALRCLHALDDPRGCGFGEYCRDCVIRNKVLETLEKGVPNLQFEAPFYFSSEEGTQPMALMVSTTPLKFQDENMALVIIMDITERKQGEKEREKLQSQLHQAQKMESVGKLAGGVAHDFNNKLAIINGYAEMALDMIEPLDPLHETIQEIHAAGVQSADIVRQLLAFARKQTISPVQLDLNDTISSMLRMLQRLIGENIDLYWHSGANLWPVKIDPSQIDQIMANLAVNSRDAISDVGKLTIETKNTIVDQDYCNSNPEAFPGRYVMLAVSDDGQGIEKEVQDRIFDPYFTTKEVGKGTGLGLPTIYGIIKQNKGFINVYSEPGQGTTFRLYFPSCETENTISHSAEKSCGKVPMGSETILLVEDEPAILKMGREMITRLGYTVLTAENPSEALKIAGEYEGTIHLLITDVVMPEMNGRDLSSQLTKTHPGIKTLYMSGYTANVVAHHGVLDEGVQFIQKPFSMKDLAVKVRETFGWE